MRPVFRFLERCWKVTTAVCRSPINSFGKGVGGVGLAFRFQKISAGGGGERVAVVLWRKVCLDGVGCEGKGRGGACSSINMFSREEGMGLLHLANKCYR